jgi:hypothetical protein
MQENNYLKLPHNILLLIWKHLLKEKEEREMEAFIISLFK